MILVSTHFKYLSELEVNEGSGTDGTDGTDGPHVIHKGSSAGHTYIHDGKITGALTFVETLLTVHDGNLVSSEAGGPVELTMVLVQLPI